MKMMRMMKPTKSWLFQATTNYGEEKVFKEHVTTQKRLTELCEQFSKAHKTRVLQLSHEKSFKDLNLRLDATTLENREARDGFQSAASFFSRYFPDSYFRKVRKAKPIKRDTGTLSIFIQPLT